MPIPSKQGLLEFKYAPQLDVCELLLGLLEGFGGGFKRNYSSMLSLKF